MLANSNDSSTHTRIGKTYEFYEDGWEIYGGNYSIKDMDRFYKLYVDKVFINKQEYLTETQNRNSKGPLLVDLDFRFNSDTEDRQHDEGLFLI